MRGWKFEVTIGSTVTIRGSLQRVIRQHSISRTLEFAQVKVINIAYLGARTSLLYCRTWIASILTYVNTRTRSRYHRCHGIQQYLSHIHTVRLQQASIATNCLYVIAYNMSYTVGAYVQFRTHIRSSWEIGTYVGMFKVTRKVSCYRVLRNHYSTNFQNKMTGKKEVGFFVIFRVQFDIFEGHSERTQN